LEVLRFLLQVTAVLLVTGLCGRLARRIGQPAVVGEMAGGLLLGPTAFGLLWPHASTWLFAAAHLRGLELLSQAGLTLFLFLLGAEMDLAHLARRGRLLLLTATGSIAAPFVAGAAMALWLAPRFRAPSVSLAAFILFVGTAFSITALPVLGRILRERAQQGKPLPRDVAELAFAAAVVNDAVAWILLLAALLAARAGHAAAGQGTANSLGSLGLALLFVAVMVFAIRPLLQQWVDRTGTGLPQTAACLALAFASAWVTDTLGLHAFFGAVLAGICAPRAAIAGKPWAASLEDRLRPFTAIALPMFFALTGLRTKLSVHAGMGFVTLAILLIAALSKLAAGSACARLGGMTWRHATEVGLLLNTRGLVELVVLNVGLREGVLTPPLFSALVFMALATTAMTVPALDLASSKALVRLR
jgi:Kef-type K+ transport system membrane component KefB